MKRDSFVMQSGLALRVLVVIIVMLTTATTAWADNDPDKLNLAVPENKTKAIAGQVKAEDDESNSFTFEITGGTVQDLFDIGLTSGVVSMKPGVDPFDYEEWIESGTKYTIKVEICDTRATSFSTDLCSEYTFPVSITDVNEKPYFTNESNVISIAEGAAVSTDAITYDDLDKYATGTFRNNELVITGGRSDLFEITAAGFVKPKDGAVINEAGEYKLEVRVQDANRDGDLNLVYPDLYEDKTFTIRYYTTGIDYMDWDDSQKKLVSKNTATDDNDANDKVWLLDGTETMLGAYNTETWCFVPTDGIDYSSVFFLSGDVHIILADGATMNHKIETLRNSETLTIHGQSEGTGKLTGGSLSVDADIAINGGIIEINSENSYAISSAGNIFFNGGQVTATATGSNDGIWLENYNNNIVLRWTKASDFIQASSYYLQQSDCVMRIDKGKGFLIDGTETVFGSATADYVFSDDERTAIAGQKLIPALPIAMGGVDYLAFTNGIDNWKPLGDDVQVYAVTGYDLTAGQVYLKPIADNVIPKGIPVVIGNKNEGDPLPGDIFLVGSDAQTTTVEGLLKGFVACDGSKSVQDYLEETFGEGVSASEYIPYLLKGDSFKAVLVSANDVIKQDVCLLFIPKLDLLIGNSVGTTGAGVRGIGIGGKGTTVIEELNNSRIEELKSAGAWYDLQGRRLSGKPTKKGLYLFNGKKVFIISAK